MKLLGPGETQADRLASYRATHRPSEAGGWTYHTAGAAPETLLLLPGGLRDAETLFCLITAFSGEYRVIAPTYPAAGTLAEVVSGVQTVLDAEGVPVVHAAWGTSLGGFLLQALLRAVPGRIRNAVLANTTTPQGWGRDLPARMARLERMRAMPEPELLALIRRQAATASAAGPFWTGYLGEIAERDTKAHQIAMAELALDFCRQSYTPGDLDGWAGRLMLIESADDLGMDAEARRLLRAMYPEAALHRFRDGGHTPLAARPDEYVLVMAAFLRSCRA
ncbi:alpha/beta fold hydrolase [Nonomuraea typhae]|uniref:alpha/beta fold hydrolase n=1 Tax=Nonomuraea typhae TaxID=2603600 RepID=UPI0012FC8E58|nr:alpha/beta hydrolase [Nonomuraea typhae]